MFTGGWRSLSHDEAIAAHPPRLPAIPYTDIAALPRELRNSYPTLSADHWGLTVTGGAAVPLMLSYSDLLSLPSAEVDCTISSIGQPAGSRMIGHARWRGVPVSRLLDELGADPTLYHARIVSADGRDTSLTRRQFEHGLLAYMVNGELLPEPLGFPVRLIVPGVYDYKMPGWVTRIELLRAPFLGFWERRGWSQTGDVQTISGILAPHPRTRASSPVLLRGYAYAGLRRITRVELSVDHGPWAAIPFTPGSPGAWSVWEHTWYPPAPGAYSVRVRATDETGFTQDEHAVDMPFPNGSCAVHQMSFEIA